MVSPHLHRKMSFLPKLFRHGHSNSFNSLEVGKSMDREKYNSNILDEGSISGDLIVNSGFIIRVIDGNTLSVVSLSENYGFIHRIEDKIIRIIPNKERENFFLILCAMDIIHLIKINTGSLQSTNGEVQRISSFKIENVTSVEWHPNNPQKFFTAGPYEVCVWNLQRLNSIALKGDSNITEITLELASQCSKTLPLTPIYESLKLRSVKSRCIKLFPLMNNHGMIALIDDEFALVIGESNDSVDGIPSLSMHKCINLSPITSQHGMERIYFTYGDQLLSIVDDNLYIYQLDLNESSNNIIKDREMNPVSSDDELVSESEVDGEVMVNTIVPNVVKLPIVPLYYAVGSNLYIAMPNGVDVMIYMIELDTHSIKSVKIVGDLPIQAKMNGMAISHPNANFIYMTIVIGNNMSNNNENKGEVLQMLGRLLKIGYSNECPINYRLNVVKVEISSLGIIDEGVPKYIELPKESKVIEIPKKISIPIDSPISVESIPLNGISNQVDIEVKLRELIINVIVPSVNEALRVSLESMSLQILRHLGGKNGMYTDLVKRIGEINDKLGKVVDRLGEVNERIGEAIYKIDDMTKCVTVRIDSLEENIESANYELSAKYQSFDDKLLDLIEQKEYDKAFALASQMDLNTDSDFTLTLCEHFDTCTFFDNERPPLTQLTLLNTCAALAHSNTQLETRVTWIAECLSLLECGSGDFPTKKIPLLLPKISSYLESLRSYTHLRDKVRFASNVCVYLSRNTKHTSKGKHKVQHN